jgi:hypothetical protein
MLMAAWSNAAVLELKSMKEMLSFKVRLVGVARATEIPNELVEELLAAPGSMSPVR